MKICKYANIHVEKCKCEKCKRVNKESKYIYIYIYIYIYNYQVISNRNVKPNKEKIYKSNKCIIYKNIYIDKHENIKICRSACRKYLFEVIKEYKKKQKV